MNRLTQVDIWHVAASSIPASLWHMATDPRRLRTVAGLRFARSLGTGRGDTFTVGDADWRTWVLVSVWDAGADPLAAHPVLRGWNDIATEHTTLHLKPLSARGRWSGQEPFTPESSNESGLIAAITRARVKPRHWWTFHTSVAPVVADLHSQPGLLYRIGIGEAPIGLQGTFSVWRSHKDINEFAYRRTPHKAVIDRTRQLDWYAEELFARFLVLDVQGTPLWSDD